MNRQGWPCDRVLGTAVLFHIWKTSLPICCFLVLAQMVYVWEKLTGQAVRQWEIFSKYPSVKDITKEYYVYTEITGR